MLKRTKIKNGDFICNDCSHSCSRYIDKYRYTKEELLGHMEYMKQQEKLYASLGEPSQGYDPLTRLLSISPSATKVSRRRKENPRCLTNAVLLSPWWAATQM